MADDKDQEDKTEDPTERRIEQAIERGDVPKSLEAASFFALSAGLLALMITGSVGLQGFVSGMRGFLENAHQVSMRIFGKEAFVQFIKTLLKFVIVGGLLLIVLWPERKHLGTMVQLDVGQLLDVTWALSLKLMGGVLALYAFVAAADILYQRFSWRQRLKMTREELKQEFKETEGSPEIKAKIRKLRAESAKRRMMAAVPKASLVLTNPTHYSVALKYEPGMNAPVLVAKGVDTIAMKIREIAGAHDIPIVENPPLARAIHARVEIDEEIPEEHYKAVAEVIGYVMRLRRSSF